MRHFAARREFYRSQKCRKHRCAHRKGLGCMADQDRPVALANKTSRRGCPRCKWAEPSPRLLRWPRRAAPPCKASLLASSSGSLNFRFLTERRSQINERDARVPQLRTAVHALDHEFNLVDWLDVIAHADEVRTFESLIGNVLRNSVFVFQCDLDLCEAVVFYVWCLVID